MSRRLRELGNSISLAPRHEHSRKRSHPIDRDPSGNFSRMRREMALNLIRSERSFRIFFLFPRVGVPVPRAIKARRTESFIAMSDEKFHKNFKYSVDICHAASMSKHTYFSLDCLARKRRENRHGISTTEFADARRNFQRVRASPRIYTGSLAIYSDTMVYNKFRWRKHIACDI